MNNTLKSLCELVKSDNAELQRAAALVLSHINIKEPGIFKAIGDALATCESPEVIMLLIRVLKQSPQEQNIRHLLSVVGNEAVDQREVIEAIASIGPKAAAQLQKVYPKCDETAQYAIIRAMGAIRNDIALSLIVSCFSSNSAPIVRQAIRSIRKNAADFNKKERLTLHSLLKKALADKKTAKNELALSAILITFGIMGETKNKVLLLPYIDREQSRRIRRYALTSLGQIDYRGDSNGDAIKALMEIATNEEDEELVRLAVEALSRIPPRKSDSDKIARLLELHRPSCVYSFALRMLGKIDTIKNARTITTYLTNKDQNLRTAAEEALPNMNTAQTLLLGMLDDIERPEGVEPYLNALGRFRGKVKPDAINALVKKLFRLLDHDDERYSIYLKALFAVDGEELQASVVKHAARERKKKKFFAVKEYLKLLAGTPFLTDELKFDLAIAKLKSGSQPLKTGQRTTDYGLRLIGELLQSQGKDFVRKFLSNRLLDADDYHYVGYHFLERLNEERRFGADCLQHVIKKWKKGKAVTASRKKLKTELNI